MVYIPPVYMLQMMVYIHQVCKLQMVYIFQVCMLQMAYTPPVCMLQMVYTPPACMLQMVYILQVCMLQMVVYILQMVVYILQMVCTPQVYMLPVYNHTHHLLLLQHHHPTIEDEKIQGENSLHYHVSRRSSSFHGRIGT